MGGSIKRNDLEFYEVSAADWWNEAAKIYALNHLNPARFEFFDRYLRTWQNVAVLDVGCGGGFSCEFMAKRGAIVAGVDQSLACIECAHAHAIAEKLAIDYRQSAAEQLPYPSKTFDCVVCVDVLEHVANLPQTIQEIHRVLKPGGLFFFDTVNRTLKSRIIMIWLLENILREIPQGIHDWQKFIKPEELTGLMQRTGFTDMETVGFNLFGSTILENLRAYRFYRQTKRFHVNLDRDRSLMYIGKATKQ